MTELWKDIPGYEGRYQASSLGQIRSLDYMQANLLTGGISKQKGKVLNQSLSKDGYVLVCIKSKTSQAHRLICAAFHGPAPEKAECCHANDIRTDNRAENLSWGTRQSNAKEMAVRDRIKGERHPRAQVTAFQAFMIQQSPHTRGNGPVLAKALGVSHAVISGIWSGRNWAWL
jgi:hypothetical protein